MPKKKSAKRITKPVTQSTKKKISFAALSQFAFATPATLLLTSEVIIGICASFLSLVFFIHFTGEMYQKELLNFDLGVSQMVYALRTPFLTQVMIGFSILGEQGTLFIGCLLTIFLLLKKHKKEATLFSVVLIIGAVLDVALKSLMHRERPQISPLIIEHTYSFPSGHAMNAFIFYSLLSYFSFHFFKNKPLSIVIGIVSALLIFLIGFSRIYLGVHYPSDVIAGYIAGFWWFVTVLVIDRTMIFFKLFRKSQ